jgi:uncharacterized protein
MKHLEAVFTGKNSFWRYIILITAVFAAAMSIGSLPMYIAVLFARDSNPGVAEQLSANPYDLTVLGVDQVTGMALQLVTFLAAFFALALLVRPLHERSFMMTINGAGTFRWNRFLIGALVWILVSALYLFVYMGVNPENFTINNTSISLLKLGVVALILIPFQAGFEELLFRGYLMQGLFRIVPRRWFPLIITSLIFGLMHSFNPEVKDLGFITMMPHYLLFGFIFGIIAILDDGIEAAMGTHAANNFFLTVMVTHKSSALQTPAVFEMNIFFPWFEFAGGVLMTLIIIIILGRIFRWDYRLLLR